MDWPLQDNPHGKAAKRACSFSPEENGSDILTYPCFSGAYDSSSSLRLRANICMHSIKCYGTWKSSESLVKDIPVLSDSKARKKSIIDDTPALFNIEENSSALGSEPLIELEVASQVSKWCGLIQSLAIKHKVDPNLAKAIMYMETTHGWYDKFYPFRKTILPMNVHYQYWRDLGATEENLNCPFNNIEIGVILLARISARIKSPTPRKVATIYNFLGAEKVNKYGARVGKLMKEKPWVKQGCVR